MNNGALNVHFMIFNKDYIMNLKNGYSTIELGLSDLNEENDIPSINNKLEEAKKMVLEDWTLSKKFESSINSISLKEETNVYKNLGNVIDVYI